jgi:hypothetical protein
VRDQYGPAKVGKVLRMHVTAWGSAESRQGQSLVEIALILPVLLILLSGLLDLGRLFFVYVAVTDAAAEGATYGAAYPPLGPGPTWGCTEPEQSTEPCPPDAPREPGCLCLRAREAAGGLVTLEDAEITVACPGCVSGGPSGSTLTVTVTYPFSLLTPGGNALVPGGVLPLRAVATEAIVAGGLP